MIIDRRGIEIPVDGIVDDSDIEPSAGLAIKEACRVATTANITLNGQQTIDGIAVVEGDRVLVKNQTDTTQNGIYDVSTGNWARSADFNETGEVVQGTQVLVTAGTVNATKTFFVTTANPITIDVTGIAIGSVGAQPLDATLTALAALDSTAGFLVETAADTFTKRTLQPPVAGITISNPAGVAGDPTVVLANDLAALEGLGSTGIAVRTAADTWAQRTITGTAAEIIVTNGNGVAGNPTLSLPTAITMTGKTLTGGSYSGITITTSTFNGNTWTAGTGTLTIAAGKIATVNNTLTFAGTDGTTMTMPSTSATLARTDAANTFTGHQTIEGITSTGATGAGKFVFDGTPTLVTPVLGVATATSVNKVAFTAPANSATLTIPDGVTLTGPAASGTAMTLGNTETVTGVKTFGSSGAVGRLKVAGTTSGSTVLDASATASGTLTLPAATDTLVGKATTDTLTNKTFDTAGTGNSFSINGVAATANTGTGAVARAAGPTFTTPALGAATATSINGNTFTTGTYTLTGAAGKTFTFSNSLTLAGTDGSTLNIGTGGTLGTNAYTSTAYAALAANNTFVNQAATPGQRIQFDSSDASPISINNQTLTLSNFNTTNNNYASFMFTSKDSGGTERAGAGIMGVFTHAAAMVQTDLIFFTREIGGGVDFPVYMSGNRVIFGSSVSASFPALIPSSTTLKVRLGDDSAYAPFAAADITANAGTAIPAGGTAGAGLKVSSTANFGVFFGSGAPSLSAAKGSLYLRSDGSGTGDRMYINTNGSTTWTNVVTAA